MSTSDLKRYGAALVGAAVLLMQLAVWYPKHARRPETNIDWCMYYIAAEHAEHREPLYQEALNYRFGSQDPPNFYLYPPPMAVALAPLTLLGPAAFQAVWYALILVAFWVYAAALTRVAGARCSLVNVLIAGVIVELMPGTATTMSYGNADMIVWALCALALDGSSLWSGVAAAIKVYPGWLLLRRERWTGIAVGLWIFTISLITVGIGGWLDWSNAIAVLGSGPRIATNVSLTNACVRVATWLGWHGSPHAFLFAAPTVLVPSVAWALQNRSRAFRGACTVVAAVLLGPLCWTHYAPMLLMPVAAWIGERRT